MSHQNAKRRTKAQRAYDDLRSTATHFVIETDLKRIARAINPMAEDYASQILILDDHAWLDNDLPPGLDTLGTGNTAYFWRMPARLKFFREEIRNHSSGKMRHDTRAVWSFPRADGTHCWLDCETGLPWVPEACRRVRSDIGKAEERAARDRQEMATARAVLQAIAAERQAERDAMAKADAAANAANYALTAPVLKP